MGTTVTMSVILEPLFPKSASRTWSASGRKPEEIVLVVDDEPAVRMLIVEVLEDQGYAAIEAVDGFSGIAPDRASPTSISWRWTSACRNE